MSIPLNRPASVVSQRIQLVALVCFLATSVWLRGSTLDSLSATFLLCASYALPVALLERWRLKPHRSPSAGLEWDSPPRPADWSRIGTKLFGFGATLTILAVAYRLFPEYAAELYKPFFAAAGLLLVPVLLLAPLYVHQIDGRMKKPEDGLWHFGALLLGRRGVDLEAVRQYALGWLVKGFFLPLMFSYLHNNLAGIRARPPAQALDLLGWHFLLYDYLILVDVGCIVVGYALTLRLLDTQIRSAEPSVKGWFWTILCYQPFWGLIGPQYLAYHDEADWRAFFDGRPLALALCSAAILGLMGIYTWASLSFGLRFSNLTHRGIVTNGPYRFSRHPAYVSKNLSWWIEALPFLMPLLMGLRSGVWRGYWAAAAARCLRLLCVNLIYLVRAWTEERHLSRDPVYVRYALWVERHGLLARLVLLFPALRYRPPEGWEPEPSPEGGGGRRGESADSLTDETPAEQQADAVWIDAASRAGHEGAETAQALPAPDEAAPPEAGGRRSGGPSS